MSSSNVIKRHSLNHGKALVEMKREGDSNAGAMLQREQSWEPMSLGRGVGSTALQAVGSDSPGRNPLDDEVLVIAHLEAETIIEQGKAAAEAIRLQAYREGYEEGYSVGLVVVQDETSGSTRRLMELARDAVVDMDRILKASEEAIVGLALTIAERVVYTRLAEDRTLVVSMVKGALEYADFSEVIRVRVNPEDFGILRPHWDEGRLGNAGKNIELEADPRVQSGGCIIDAKSAVLDAQIDTKLAEIDKALRAELDVSTR